ncbi:MAG: hypothetical protein D6820_03760 [Lentisphaerae bacterium]|nr:MAG: hypothetical protein D6820_03760 [Lentisphaerota bacterium]
MDWLNEHVGDPGIPPRVCFPVAQHVAFAQEKSCLDVFWQVVPVEYVPKLFAAGEAVTAVYVTRRSWYPALMRSPAIRKKTLHVVMVDGFPILRIEEWRLKHEKSTCVNNDEKKTP